MFLPRRLLIFGKGATKSSAVKSRSLNHELDRTIVKKPVYKKKIPYYRVTWNLRATSSRSSKREELFLPESEYGAALAAKVAILLETEARNQQLSSSTERANAKILYREFSEPSCTNSEQIVMAALDQGLSMDTLRTSYSSFWASSMAYSGTW